MNICILVHLFPARSETFVREHVVGMAKRGHQVTVISRKIGDGILEKELQELDELKINRVYLGEYQPRLRTLYKIGIAILKSPFLYPLFRDSKPWTNQQLLTALSAIKHIINLKPNLVHIHFGDLAARLLKASSYVNNLLPPTIVTWHGYEANALPKLLGEDIYNELFSTNFQHTVGSIFMYRRLLALGCKEEMLSIIPMGIDLKKFAFSERKINDNQPLKVLSVGRLDEVKGHKFLIEAVKQLKEVYIPISLRIVGEGPLRHALESQIKDAELQDCITLLGALPSDNIVEKMQQAEVFALTGVEAKTGRVESQGVVFAEAQATGLPVIACDVGGVSDSVVNGETGILCKPSDPSAIAKILQFFFFNRKEIIRYGRNARRFVEERFSIEAMLNTFENLYGKKL